MIRCEAVIFDMDGVIVDTEPRHKAAFLSVCEDIGYGETHGFVFEDYVGRSDQVLWEDFIARHAPSYTLEALLRLKRQKVIESIRAAKPVFDGLVDLVKALHPRYKLALASGSEREIVDEVLAIDGLKAYFSDSVSCSEVARGKPEPEIFLRAADLLGVPPGGCCVIEDSKPGIAAGLAAGMRVIAITNTHSADELCQAHHVVSTYEEILQLLS